MAVKIRLLRMGKIRNPQYRIVVADSRTKRDGRAIEYVGIYQPKEHPSIMVVKSERVQYWLSVGAQPSEAVQRILEKTGDWQQFKGLPAPPPLLMKEEKVSHLATYEAEAKLAAGIAEATAAAKPAKKATKAKADSAGAKGDAAKGDAAKGDAAKGDAAKGDAAKGDAAKGDAAKGDAAKGDAAKGDAAKGDAAKGDAAKGDAAKAAAPEAAAAKPTDTIAVDPAPADREAVAETAGDPAGAGADAS